jgi:hypothetical protein
MIGDNGSGDGKSRNFGLDGGGAQDLGSQIFLKVRKEVAVAVNKVACVQAV